MDNPKHQDSVRDDLSDAASSIAEVRTLNDEPLPSYNEVSTSSKENLPQEKTISPSQSHLMPEQSSRVEVPLTADSHPQNPEQNRDQVPTAADPFAFPSQAPPAYPEANAIYRPLAIPQMTPSAAAPFLPAYPTALLSFGIPSDSWSSFVDTVSAFLSAKVSQQAIHHAADIASNIGDFHKQYALRSKEHFKNIGKSAKRFSPAGVLGGTIGVTMGSVGHIVTTVFQAAGSLRLKPQTPRERAAVYVESANVDWFHSRGLHAVLMDTSELSKLCEVKMAEMLSAALMCGSISPALQLASLQDIIGEVRIEEASQDDMSSKESVASSSKAAGKRRAVPHLELGGTTLWLVLVQRQDDLPDDGKSSSHKEVARQQRA